MKGVRNIIVTLMAVVLTAGLILNFAGCTKESPLDPKDKGLSNKGELNFISLGDGSPFVNKIIQASDSVTIKNGGKLTLEYKLKRENAADIRVVITLNVLPHTISEDAVLTLSLDDQQLVGNVDFAFAPHGITFSEPAILNIEAKSLDLSDIDPEKIDIYYDNPETGEWEKMERKAVIVKQNKGFINIVVALLRHFSRYAVAWSN